MTRDPSKWIPYLVALNTEDLQTLATEAIARLIEIDEVRFREQDDDPEFGCKAELYWESCGDSLLD